MEMRMCDIHTKIRERGQFHLEKRKKGVAVHTK